MNSASRAGFCLQRNVAPKPFWPTQLMSDSDVAGDSVEPHVRSLCRKRCEMALGPLQGAPTGLRGARFGLWRTEYTCESGDLCSDFAGEVVLGIVRASSQSGENTLTPSKDSGHERFRRCALQQCAMSSVEVFEEHPVLSVAPLQVPV